MQKPKIVFSLEEIYRHKDGWTYFLLSKDKRYLKIGKTTSDLGLRIKSINNDMNYRGNDFSLLVACVDAKNEKRFHYFFREYRACFNWQEPDNRQKNLSSEQIWSLAVKSSKAKYGIYRKHYVYWEIKKYCKKTIVELFRIPPKKLAPMLVFIIQKEFECIQNEKGTKNSHRLERTVRNTYV
ncbi:hypothetical protein VT25_19365 [Photobacterium leiognathi subsp. mandapamensis]|nr:hypothetical protein VT25_19365 [Photobacterium leiognathi subsp. mandapamensis]